MRYAGMMMLVAVMAAPRIAGAQLPFADPAHAVTSLEFRAAAFELYQRRYFSSIVHILQIADSPSTVYGGADNTAFLADYLYHDHDFTDFSQSLIAGRLSGSLLSKAETEGLMADLYLALGLPQAANQMLRQLGGARTVATRHSWLSMARYFYRHGYLKEAVQALSNLDDVPNGDLQAEGNSLSALLSLAQHNDQEAITALQKAVEHDQGNRAALDRYNLELALIDKGDLQEATAVIAQSDKSVQATPDAAELHDLAAIDLGYALIDQKQLDQAGAVLQQSAAPGGAYSDYALLGAGWVESLKGDQRKALDTWLPLLKSNSGGEAVQEGLLAISNAYYQLQDYTQAMSHYQLAADSYQKELAEISRIRASLLDNSFIAALLAANPGSGQFDSEWYPKILPAAPALPYLLPTLAGYRFQEGLRNYRDLGFSREILQTAAADAEASLSLIAKQRDAQTLRRRQTPASDQGLGLASLSARLNRVQTDLDRAEANHDILALATAEQTKLLFKLKDSKRLLDAVKNYMVDYDDLYAKYRLLHGLMVWQLTEQFPTRLQEVRQQLHDVELALGEASKKQQLQARSYDKTPGTLDKQASGYKTLLAKQATLAATVQPLLDRQRQYLQKLLLTGIASGETRLTQYLLQARLGIAQATDQLAGASAKKDYGRSIAAYQAFLDMGDESPYRREVMSRLSYLEMLQADNGDTRGDALYNEAITLMVRLLKDYPNDPDNYRVLYNLAKAYDHRGETDSLLDTLTRLSNEYPSTAYSDEIQFRRGELLLSLGLPDQAAEAYSAVITRHSASPFYEKARYKLAWSYFKGGRYDAAVGAFLSLLQSKLHGVAKPDLTRGDQEMVNDILRGAALSLTQLGGAQTLADYFAHHGEQAYEYRLYETLAQIYLDQQRIEDAAATYRTFVAQHPNHPQAPLFDSKILAAYRQGGFIDLLQKAKADFINRYEPAAAYWTNNPGAPERTEALRKVRDYLQEMARYAHAKAQLSKAESDYREAEHWYRLFLASYPQDPAAVQMHFLLGEILFDDGRYSEAMREYQKVAYDYKDADKGAEAAYAAALAQQKIAASLSGGERQAAEHQSLLALQRFAETYPGDSRAPAALMKAAQEWYSLKDRARATLAAQHLLDMKPAVDSELRRSAWTLLGLSAFDERHYAVAEQDYQQALALMAKDDGRRRDTEENLAAAIYKQGEQARAAGDSRSAINHFLRISDVAPSAGIAATAQYDAAATLLSLEDWRAAIKILERFRKNYPGNPLQKDIAPKLALAYQKINDWPKAAAELEIIATQDDGEALRRDAVWQSADLYLKAGQPQQAQRMLEEYVRRFPKPVADAIEAEQRLSDLDARQGDAEKRRFWLQRIIETDRSAGMERSDRTRLLAGRAALTLADAQYQSFAAITLTHPLKKSLARKKKAMEIALAAYRDAGEYGIAEITTAATYRAAQIYGDLGKAILASERPKGLSALEAEQYEVLLEEQAYPFEEKAIGLYEVNARRTAEKIYNDWVKKSFAALSKLLPGRYAKTEKGEAYVDAIY